VQRQIKHTTVINRSCQSIFFQKKEQEKKEEK